MQTVFLTSFVQEQIDKLHRLTPKKEWSGLCVYKQLDTTKSITQSDLEVVYIAPRDFGTAAFTSSENLDKALIDILMNFDMNTHRTGYIHSHHSMDTFFSGTDLKELEEMAFNHFDQFLSVIVNVFGKHNAKLAIKAEVSSIVEWNLGNHKEKEEVKSIKLKTFDLKVRQRKSTDPLWTLFDSQLNVLKEEIAQKAALIAAQTNTQINKAHNAMDWGMIERANQVRNWNNEAYNKTNPKAKSFLEYVEEPEELENTFCDNAFTLFDAIIYDDNINIDHYFKIFLQDNPIPKRQKVAYVKELLSYLKEYREEFDETEDDYHVTKRSLDYIHTLILNLQ